MREPEMGKAAIELEGVGVNFNGALILEDVNLTIEAGRYVGILGPNGAGKSTLLKVILGLIRPQRGQCGSSANPRRSCGIMATWWATCRSGPWETPASPSPFWTWCSWAATAASACSNGPAGKTGTWPGAGWRTWASPTWRTGSSATFPGGAAAGLHRPGPGR